MLVALAVVAALASVVALGAPARAQQPDPSARRARATALVATGERYLAAGDPGSAIAYFRDAVGTDPDYADAFDALGRAYLGRGRVTDAIDALRAGIRRRPEAARLWRDLARALETAGDLEEASRALRECTRRAPEDPEAFVARASLARRRSKWSEALGAYRRVLDLAAGGASVAATDADEARRYAAALEVLVGGVDPVRDRSACSDTTGPRATLVRRTLARCRPAR